MVRETASSSTNIHADGSTLKHNRHQNEVFFNISLKDEMLKSIYVCCPRVVVKIMLDDFNTRMSKQGIFGRIVEKLSLQDDIFLNEL